MANYEYNKIYKSPLTDHFYFAKKVKIIEKNGKDTGERLVVGQKIDVTDSVSEILLMEYIKDNDATKTSSPD